MPDYKVAALIETNAGQVAREVRGSADAIDQVGASATRAAKGTDELAIASRRLADAQHAASVADAAVAKMQDRTDASRPKIIANMREYSRAIEEQRASRIRLAQATKAAQDVQDKSEAAQARAASRGGSGGGGTSARTIAAGVGIGVAAEKAIELVTEKAKEFFTGSVEQASALQETLGTSVEIFGGYAQQVDKFGKGSANALGLSRQAAIETTDTFGSLFHAVGVEGAKALDASTGLTKLGVDLAAFKREADPGFAFHALQQALSGQYDALHNYDIVLTSATVRQEAYRLGLIRTRTDALTPQATALAAASLATAQAHTQTGAFARSSDELAGKQKILSANIKDAQAELGKGLLPAMSGAADIAEGTLVPALKGVGAGLAFIGEHAVTRHLAEIALAMYGLAVAVNVTAAAYGRLAGSATAAATAEGAAAGGAARGVIGGTLAAVGGAAAAVGVAGVATLTGGLHSIGTVKRNAQAQELDRQLADLDASDEQRRIVQIHKRHLGFAGTGAGLFSIDRFFTGVSQDRLDQGEDLIEKLRGQAARLGSTDLAPQSALQRQVAAESARRQRNLAAAQTTATAARENARLAVLYTQGGYKKDAGSIPLGGLLDALPEKPDQSVVQNARDEQKAATAAIAIAEARVKQARAGSGGASAGQIASLRASVLTAQDAVDRRGGNPEAETLRLQAAQARLNNALAGGKTNTVALMTAEKGLEDAQVRRRKAAENLHKAEKDASGDKSLSLQEVLARASRTAKVSTAEVGNVRSLVKAGVTQPVIAELEQLEQTAPGTIAKVAKGLTPAFVKQLNADQAARDKAQVDLASLGAQATAKAATEGARMADQLVDGLTKRLGELNGTVAAAAAGLFSGAGETTAGQRANSAAYQNALHKNLFAGLPPGVATGLVVPPAPVVLHAPAPVVVAPRQTTHHNTFPDVKTTVQVRAELARLESQDARR